MSQLNRLHWDFRMLFGCAGPRRALALEELDVAPRRSTCRRLQTQVDTFGHILGCLPLSVESSIRRPFESAWSFIQTAGGGQSCGRSDEDASFPFGAGANNRRALDWDEVVGARRKECRGPRGGGERRKKPTCLAKRLLKPGRGSQPIILGRASGRVRALASGALELPPLIASVTFRKQSCRRRRHRSRWQTIPIWKWRTTITLITRLKGGGCSLCL